MTLKLNGSSSGYTAIDAPASAGSNTLTLPANNGTANQYLKNTGTAGILEFATLSAGKVLQILTAADNDHTLTTSYSDIYSSDLAITLASTSSKVLVIHNTHEIKLEGSGTQDLEASICINRTTSGDTFDTVGVARARCRNNSHAGKIQHQVTCTYVDSGFSNTANTYNVHAKKEGSGFDAWCYHNQLILIEIGA